MPLQWSQVIALRVDARGHVGEVLITFWDSGWKYSWYKLDGTFVACSPPIRPIINLRVDARGHIVAVQFEHGPGGEYGAWYDLDGVFFEATGVVSVGINHVRVDARGHVLAVQMTDGNWYDLSGKIAV